MIFFIKYFNECYIQSVKNKKLIYTTVWEDAKPFASEKVAAQFIKKHKLKDHSIVLSPENWQSC